MKGKKGKEPIKQQQVADNSGVAKQNVDLKFRLDFEFEPQEEIAVAFEWISGSATQWINVGELRSLELPQNEEEEKEEEKDPKKGKKDLKKKIEVEWEENKIYEGFFQHTIENLTVDEEFVRGICDNRLRLIIVDSEAKKVIFQQFIDYSSMIMYDKDAFGTDQCFKYNVDLEEGPSCIKKLTLGIHTSKDLLSMEYKRYLNPLEVEIREIEDLYINEEKKYRYEKLLIKYDFFNEGTYTQTERVSTQRNTIINQKHVFLVGLHSQIKLKEYLQSNYITFEVHDRDELKRSEIKSELEYIKLEESEKEEEEELLDKKGKKIVKKQPEKKKEAPPPKKQQEKKKSPSGELKIDEIEFPETKEYIDLEHAVVLMSFHELLNPYALEASLTTGLVPRKLFVDSERNNLELNKTARKAKKELIKATEYLENNSRLTVSLRLLFPLDRYEKSEAIDPALQSATSMRNTKTSIKGKKQEESQPIMEEVVNAGPTYLQTLRKTRELSPFSPTPLIERVVYLFEYKNRNFLKLLQETIVALNLESLGLVDGNERDLRTLTLTEEQRADPTFDFIGGVEIIDKDFRLFILEGVSYGSMAKLGELIPLANANNDKFKILKNPRITFNERLYSEFDVDIKKIKLRTPVSQLVLQPDIYDRKMVPMNIYRIINQLRKIRERNTIEDVVSSNLWPLPEPLIAFERNYGDSLTKEDITGVKPKIRKKKRQAKIKKTSEATAEIEENEDFASELTSMITMDHIKEAFAKSKFGSDGASMKKSAIQSQNEIKEKQSNSNPRLESSIRIGSGTSINRKQSGKRKVTFVEDSKNRILQGKVDGLQGRPDTLSHLIDEQQFNYEKKRKFATMRQTVPNPRQFDKYTMHFTRPEIDTTNKIERAEGDWMPQETIYSTQMRHLREIARNDPDYFYTYSEKYMSLSIDPYLEDEVRRNRDREHKSKFLTEQGFQNVLKKDPKDYNKHPMHLHETQVTNIHENPYHKEKQRTAMILKEQDRGAPIQGKVDFKKFLPKIEYFTNFEKHESEKMSSLEQKTYMESLHQQEKKNWEKKIVVEDPTFHVDTSKSLVYGMDKYKDILHSEAKKPGLILPKKYLKDAVVKMDRILKPSPISYNAYEKKLTKTEQEALLRLERNYDEKQCLGREDFRSHFGLANNTEFIHKKMLPNPLD